MIDTLLTPQVFAQTAGGLFLAILFLQSGLDKIFNWKGNRDWINEHFSKSILARSSTMLLAILTAAELVAGLLCLAGLVLYWTQGLIDVLIVGVEVSIVALLMLFFGQRLAQDYPGAQTIAIYFAVALLVLRVMG